MTLRISNLSSTLKNAVNNSDFTAVKNSAEEALNSFDATRKSLLGGVVGEIKGGIEALTKNIDDAKDALTMKFLPTISRITKDIEGASEKLLGKVPLGQIKSDIEALTGKPSAAADGFLKEIISHPSAQAVETALKKFDVAASDIENALKSIVILNLGDIITKSLGNSPFGKFLESAKIFTQQLDTISGANSELFMVDFGEKLEKTFETNVTKIIGKVASKTDIASAFKLVAGGGGGGGGQPDYDSAFKIIEKYIDLPANYYAVVNSLAKGEWPADIKEAYDRLNSAQDEFKTLEVELSSYVSQFDPSASEAGTNSQYVKQMGGHGSSRPPAVGQGQTAPPNSPYSGTTSDGDIYDFSDITSIDELEALFRSISRPAGREIAGAIIHWSATCLDQNWGSQDINAVHIAKGWANGCGYHLIIRRDGTLQRGRPMNLAGAHDENNNETFLGFCFIGGVNVTAAELAASGKPDWQLASAASFTAAQYNSYDQLMAVFHKVWSHGQVQGHYATSDKGKIDPGFDVPGYSHSKYNHVNVIPEGDPIWKSPSKIITIETIAEYVSAQ